MPKTFFQFLLLFPFFLFVGMSCQKANEQSLTEKEKQKIKDFSKDLATNLQAFNYAFIGTHWSTTGFRRNVKNLTGEEESLFNLMYNKSLGKHVYYQNVDIINSLKFNNGKIHLSKIAFCPKHVELTFCTEVGFGINFIRYKVKLENDDPVLTDVYLFKESKWLSSVIGEMVSVNVTYDARSTTRSSANINKGRYEDAMRIKDTLAAIQYLDQIPDEFDVASSYGITRISLARQVYSDYDFLQVLLEEKLQNNSEYINYLYHYYNSNNEQVDFILDNLEAKVGRNSYIDSLKTYRYIWY